MSFSLARSWRAFVLAKEDRRGANKNEITIFVFSITAKDFSHGVLLDGKRAILFKLDQRAGRRQFGSWYLVRIAKGGSICCEAAATQLGCCAYAVDNEPGEVVDAGNRGGRLVADLVGVDDPDLQHQDPLGRLPIFDCLSDQLIAPGHHLAD